ncbi:hypothetical protein QVD17_16807 [Tagetes erecta]|uniref:Uncharacterized protein n=1 Tax=Tagetes erecta TaxID=13708 RepID=A0AAD8KVN9_TARER|nr:hypothetical protein QVD17_16807 [Tagetes erecta]
MHTNPGEVKKMKRKTLSNYGGDGISSEDDIVLSKRKCIKKHNEPKGKMPLESAKKSNSSVMKKGKNINKSPMNDVDVDENEKNQSIVVYEDINPEVVVNEEIVNEEIVNEEELNCDSENEEVYEDHANNYSDDEVTTTNQTHHNQYKKQYINARIGKLQ